MVRFTDIIWTIAVLTSIGWGAGRVISAFALSPIVFVGHNISLASAAETVTVVLAPTPSWPLILFIIFLITTLEYEYFPTTAIVFGYVGLLITYGFVHVPKSPVSILITLVSIVAYLIAGGLWMYAKWWSFLHDPKNEHILTNVREGGENEFFISRIRYLYPHFLYWPLSVVHTLMTKLVYQIFEFIARRWSGTFGAMVVTRKAELKKTKTPVAARKNPNDHVTEL